MKIAFIFNSDAIFGKLAKIFTGCYAYHVVFLDEEAGTFYDMHFKRRRGNWSTYSANKEVVILPVPSSCTISREFLEGKLTNDNSSYGFTDYVLFGIRPLFHLFGKSTRNAKGVICSEMVNNDLVDCGWKWGFSKEEHPPSPCDLYYRLLDG